MRYVAAYLLATLGGNNSPSSDDIKKILGSVGIEAEDDKLNKVISELKGKNIEELIAEGTSIAAHTCVSVSLFVSVTFPPFMCQYVHLHELLASIRWTDLIISTLKHKLCCLHVFLSFLCNIVVLLMESLSSSNCRWI